MADNPYGYIPFFLNPFLGDTGSGGQEGLVPAPPPGSAAAGYFLSADGTFKLPTSGNVIDSVTLPLVITDKVLSINNSTTSSVGVVQINDDYLSGSSHTDATTSYYVQQAIANAIISGRSFRGGYDASTNLFPSTGGSGAGGSIRAGDYWIITIGGTLGGTDVFPNDTILALVDGPGQTSSNWIINSAQIQFNPDQFVIVSNEVSIKTAGITLDLLAPGGNDGYVLTSALGINPPKYRQLIPTTNQINISVNTNDITFSLPQDIALTSIPQFNSVKLTNLAASKVMVTDGSQLTAVSTVTSSELLNVGGTTSNIQTQLDGKQPVGNYITSLTSDVVASGPGAAAATIQPGVVTYAKIQNISATQRLLGRYSTGAGSTQEITVSTGLNLDSSTGVLTVTGAPPTGAAGGDLSSTYPNPVVSKINGVALGTTTATSGNILIGSGTAWVTQAMSGDITITSGGVTTIGSATVTYAKIQNTSVGQVLIGRYSASSGSVQQITLDSSLALNTGTGILSVVGAPPTGAAGGDLSGTYPNPNVAKINGATLGTTTATSGNLLIASGTAWVSTAMSGDITINSSGVTAIGALKVVNAMIANATIDLTAKVTGILPVGNGGTGTSTAFTAGSIVFAGTSGVYNQNNSSFFWNNSTTRLGIGTASPTARLTVSANTTAPPTPPSPTVAHLIGADANDIRLTIDSFGGSNGSLVVFRYANGTNASPSAVTNGTDLGQFSGTGYGTTGYLNNSSAKIVYTATEDWTDSTGAARIGFYTRPTGSVATATLRMTLSSAGVLNIAGLTASRALVTNSSKDLVSSATTDTQIGYLSGASGTTGTVNLVYSTSPTLVTPILGTPTSGTLTNCSGLPISTGVSGLGTGVATFLATPSSANLAAAVTDETGSGALVFATSPTLVTPLLGTPTSGTLTNCTGLPISTGVSGLGTGVATFLAMPSSANLITAMTDETGTGVLVFGTGPTISLPIIDNIKIGYTTTATAAGTTTLTAASNYQQYFTGTTTQTVVLPVTSTLVLGESYLVTNNSSGVVTVQSSGANTILAMPGGAQAWFTVILTSGTSAASWSAKYIGFSNPGVTSITGTANQVIASASTGDITLSTPQDIATSSSPTFVNVTASLIGNATTATTLQNTRTIWGQNFNGSANVTGSLTAITNMTGGASSMTITAGTGNSRTLTLRTTTSGGTATTALTLAADQSATFANSVTATSLTLSGLTLGSIPFVSTGGLITEDNSFLFWDNTNKRLGISTTLPTARLTVNANGADPQTAPSSCVSHFTGSNNANAVIAVDGFGGIPTLQLRMAEGTGLTPSAVLNTDVIGQLIGTGYGTSIYLANSAAKISFISEELWTNSTGAAGISFFTRPTGTTATSTLRMNLSSTGVLNISGLTASRALTTDGSKNLTSSAVTTTELGYLSGVTTPTGSGALVLATSPTLVTPALGTPSALVLTNATGLVTAGIVDANVTYAKIQNISATSRLLGRYSAGAGVTQEITISTGLSLDGSGNLTVTGAPPTGAAGGDLSSTYPNPVVSKINGVALGSTTATLANILVASGTAWVSVAMSGDITIDSTGVTAISSGVIVNADINASAGIVDTKLATISTAGKVSNSATTATDANTASAIVARDASGNFTAGTITATLSGSASTLTTTRTIWGQNFNGSANVTGSLTAITNMTGGASSMIITSGTGNSRTMTLRTTTSGGTATTALTLAADQSATFANTVNATTFVGTLTGNASTATALQNARLIGAVSFDGTADIVPQTIQTVTEGSDTTCFPLFSNSSGTGNVQPKNNAGFNYNASTNALTVTTFLGNLTGSAVTVNSPTGLKIYDSDSSNYITLAMGGNATADRNFTLNGGDADRSITLRGNLSTGNDVTYSGNFTGTFTLIGTTSVIFPTSGTLLTSTGLTSGYVPYFTTSLVNSIIYQGPGPAATGVAIGGTDVRGILTVEIDSGNTWVANTDPTDSGRFFVMENLSATGNANEFANITLQIYPTGSLPGGRCLADIRLVRTTANQSNSTFLFSNFNQSGNYQDVFSLGNSSSYMLSKLFLGGQTAPSAILELAAGTTTVAPLIIDVGTNLTSPVSGAIENDGTALYYTDSSPTRQAIVTSILSTTYQISTLKTGGSYSLYIQNGYKAPVICATTGNLNATYSNGSSGVGATLTNAGSLGAFAVDGISATAGQRVLVKNQSTTANNGIYTVTTAGSGAVAWVLTRAVDYNSNSIVTLIQEGDLVLITRGSTLAGKRYYMTQTAAVTVGTTAITWATVT